MQSNKLRLVFLIVLASIISCKEKGNKQTDKIQENTVGKGKLLENRIGKSDYYISIPDDYALKLNAGPDFSVYYFSPIDTAIKAPFTGGFYFGNYPHAFEPNNDSCKVQEIKSKFLDSLTNWTAQDCQGNYSVQTIMEFNDPDDRGGKIHAFGSSKTQSGLNTVLEIFGTMKNK